MKRTTTFMISVLVLLGVLMLDDSGFSDATYTSTTTNVARVSAAPDWTPPTVSMVNPGSPVRDTVTVTADASDAESGIASVTLQYLAPSASTWVTLCTDTTAPYSCAWNTKNGSDGSYDLRARAVDGAGLTTLSTSIRTVVANTVLIVLGDPGDVVRGSVPLSAEIFNGGALPWLVTIQYVAAGGSSWKSVCSGLVAPYTCTWATTAFANDAYDLRAVATSGTTTITSAVIPDVLVDNAAPTVALADPGSPLTGTVSFAATAADAGSGIAQVVIQYAPSGGTFQPLCTITAEPYTCRYATTALPDGSYSFRAVATDVAGNTATSATVANRIIDNTVSSVSVDDPGAFLSGTVALTAQANSTAGIASVRIQRAAAGTATWVDVCTDTTAPYSCAWDTTQVADGLWSLRAVLTDGRGVQTTSAVVADRRVDNSPLRALDVQTANGDGTAGRIDSGDTLTLTYSEPVEPSTLSNGWNGAAIPVTLRVRDGNLLGLGNKGDTVDVLRGSAAVHLGSVALREDYVKARRTLAFNATMTSATITVGGIERTVVTLHLGTLASGSGGRTVSLASTMTWSPSSAATTPSGSPCSSAPATETGAADREW